MVFLTFILVWTNSLSNQGWDRFSSLIWFSPEQFVIFMVEIDRETNCAVFPSGLLDVYWIGIKRWVFSIFRRVLPIFSLAVIATKYSSLIGWVGNYHFFAAPFTDKAANHFRHCCAPFLIGLLQSPAACIIAFWFPVVDYLQDATGRFAYYSEWKFVEELLWPVRRCWRSLRSCKTPFTDSQSASSDRRIGMVEYHGQYESVFTKCRISSLIFSRGVRKSISSRGPQGYSLPGIRSKYSISSWTTESLFISTA